MPTTPISAAAAVGLLLIAMTSIQFGAALAKGLFPLIGASAAAALRLALSSAILWAALRPWRRWPDRAQWPPLLAYGAALGVMNLSIYMALRTIPLGVAVSIEFLGPLTVALLASRRLMDVLWIGLAALGLAGFAPWSASALDPAGAGFALLAGGAWAAYILAGKGVSRSYGPRAVAIGSLIAAVGVAPFGLQTALAGLARPHVLLTGLAVAALSSAVPYVLEMIALARLPARAFGVLMSLEPALAAGLGLVMLGERLSLREGLAIAAVVSASAGMTATAARVTPPLD